MPDTTPQKCWLTFKGDLQQQPCLWRMSRAYPEVQFDIRQAAFQEGVGVMAILLKGPADDVDAAIAHLQDQGVQVDPVEGGSLVAG
jgi:hypothetical protein